MDAHARGADPAAAVARATASACAEVTGSVPMQISRSTPARGPGQDARAQPGPGRPPRRPGGMPLARGSGSRTSRPTVSILSARGKSGSPFTTRRRRRVAAPGGVVGQARRRRVPGQPDATPDLAGRRGHRRRGQNRDDPEHLEGVAEDRVDLRSGLQLPGLGRLERGVGRADQRQVSSSASCGASGPTPPTRPCSDLGRDGSELAAHVAARTDAVALRVHHGRRHARPSSRGCWPGRRCSASRCPRRRSRRRDRAAPRAAGGSAADRRRRRRRAPAARRR